uniref:Carboxylesterase type B domain-containing protein n=1 Tax=Bombyx mori TaxID=7091 RepID=A0A8R2LZT0_BOMMO|nr:juvenile hormone esterase-like [Bombyx mori]
MISDKFNHFFKDSLPTLPFNEIYEAFDDSTACPQKEEFNNTIVGEMQCLRLNIYVPKSLNNNLPVLIYFYGGTFEIGFAGRYLYGPKYLVRHEIILVTVNYRLGPYGFLCTDSSNAIGNQGLKDQKKAIVWIRENIGVFGGDKDRITVSGHSYGASGVDLLLHSLHINEKLFHKVIIQSGTSYFPEIMAKPNNSVPFELAKRLGFKTAQLDLAIDFLSKENYKDVINAAVELDVKFYCCNENYFSGAQNFLTDYPINLNTPIVEGMSILIGNTNNERAHNYYGKKNLNFDIFQDHLQIAFNFDDEHLLNTKEIVKKQYIGNEKNIDMVENNIVQFSSDFYYYHPTKRNVLKYIDNGAKKVYNYLFSYDGNRNFLKKTFNLNGSGAFHADEIGYLFDISFMDKTLTIEDMLIVDRITTLWANFVKSGYVFFLNYRYIWWLLFELIIILHK